MATHSGIITWKIHEQRSLVGYSPWGRKELDTAEHAHTCSKWNFPEQGSNAAPCSERAES